MRDLDRAAIVRVKKQIAPLFKAKAWIYWTDMLSSAAIGWSAFALSLHVSSRPLVALCLGVSTYANYRALAFTHELEHRADIGDLPWFRPVWHVLSGMPLCLPHFVYRGVHRIHHSTRYYGTAEDPEYVPFAAEGSFREPIKFVVLCAIFPTLVALRYLLLTPLSLFIPPLRRWLTTKLSAFAMKLDYARQLPTGAEWTIWQREEFSTALFAWTIVLSVWLGALPFAVLTHWNVVFALIMLANSVRGLAATHRYMSAGSRMTFEEHIFDSVNLQDFSLFNLIIGPLGLTYHATHHIYPTLPYYALRKAHRLLMQESQGEGHPLEFYTAGQWSTLPTSIAKLVRSIRRGEAQIGRSPISSSEPAFPDP